MPKAQNHCQGICDLKIFVANKLPQLREGNQKKGSKINTEHKKKKKMTQKDKRITYSIYTGDR